MVENVVKVASILSQPDLEDETKKAINEYIRSQIKLTSKEPDPQSKIPPPDVLSEWVNGPPKGGETN